MAQPRAASAASEERRTKFRSVRDRWQSHEDMVMARGLSQRFWHEKKEWNERQFDLSLAGRQAALEHLRREEELLEQYREKMEAIAAEDERLALQLSHQELSRVRQERERLVQDEQQHFEQLMQDENDRWEREKQNMEAEDAKIASELQAKLEQEAAEAAATEPTSTIDVDADAELARKLQQEEAERARQARRANDDDDEAFARTLQGQEASRGSNAEDEKLALELQRKEATRARLERERRQRAADEAEVKQRQGLAETYQDENGEEWGFEV